MTTPHRSPPTRALPERPDLKQLRRQAKELLKAFRAGDAAAREEVAAHYRDADRERFALHHAQLVVARAYGFESWSHLVRRVDPDYRSKRSQKMVQPAAMATPAYKYGVEQVDGNDAWALMCACADGDISTVKQLLEGDARLANAQFWYQFPLHMAVREGHVDVVKALLDVNADPARSRYTYNSWDKLLAIAQYRGHEGVQALLESEMTKRFRYDEAFDRVKSAVMARDVSAVSAIMDERPDLLHASDAFGNGPVHWATLTRQCHLIDDFLDRGADVNARRADGQAAIHLSVNGDYWYRMSRLPHASVGNAWILTGYLLAKGADLDLCIAAAVGDQEGVAKLLTADPSRAAQLGPAEKSPLGYAARSGYTTIVKMLLDSGADPNAPEQNAPRGAALFEACAGAHLETVELLLEHGADPNAEVDSSGCCLTIVKYKNPTNFKPIQELLRKHGAENPPWNMSRDELVRALQSSDPVVHTRGTAITDWGSFLHMVLQEDDTELLSLYVEKVGDAAIRQWTPVHMFGKSEPVIDLLVEHGLDVNRVDWLGRTYLHRCAEEDTAEAAAAYLKHGADINAIDLEYSEAPLGTAARCGKIEMVNFLLEQGADPNLPEDRPWARPLAYAESEGHRKVAEVLRQHGAIG